MNAKRKELVDRFKAEGMTPKAAYDAMMKLPKSMRIGKRSKKESK